MTNLYLSDTQAAILDNNFPGTWLWMSAQDFLNRWRGTQTNGQPFMAGRQPIGGGWAIVLLAGPPSPYPVQPQAIASRGNCTYCGDSCKCEPGNCPNKCPVSGPMVTPMSNMPERSVSATAVSASNAGADRPDRSGESSCGTWCAERPGDSCRLSLEIRPWDRKRWADQTRTPILIGDRRQRAGAGFRRSARGEGSPIAVPAEWG